MFFVNCFKLLKMKHLLLFIGILFSGMVLQAQIVVNENPDPLVVCDDDTDGFAQFILHDADDDITLEDPTIMVTYHLTLLDAQVNENEVLDPFININPYNDEVFARAENVEGEYAVVVLELEVLLSPTPTEPTPLEVCDENNDGFASFVLTQKDAEIANGEPNLTITYHETYIDAISGSFPLISPYENIVPFSQTIYVRVSNILTECFVVVELELVVSESPQINEPDDLFIDEGDGDGFAIFDLTVNIPIILGSLNPSEFTVSFYVTEVDSQNNTNSILNAMAFANTTNPQTIYVRIENVNSGCFQVDSFQILTDEAVPDADGDGIPDADEDLNNNGNLEDDDTDGDGIPNYLDSDDDDDTVETIDEITGIGAGIAPNYIYIDTDDDGVENYLDNDDDGDGTLTIDEDYNNNGTPLDDDTNANGILDFLDDEVFLSVGSFGFEDLTIYPNPAFDSFTVQSSQLVSQITISIYDIQGKVLISEKTLPQNGMVSMNVSSLESGVYFLKITSEGNTAVKKLIRN